MEYCAIRYSFAVVCTRKKGGRAILTSIGRCYSLQATILCFQVAKMYQVDGENIRRLVDFYQLELVDEIEVS